jgi:hypothetical protein
VTRALGILIGGTLAVWAAAYLPARFFGGQQVVAYSVAAMVICLIPTTLTLAWAHRMLTRSHSQALLVATGGTGIRMMFVLGAGLVLNQAVPYFEHVSFWAWIVGFYGLTLGLETYLLRNMKPDAAV